MAMIYLVLRMEWRLKGQLKDLRELIKIDVQI